LIFRVAGVSVTLAQRAEWFESVIDAGARAVPLRHDFDSVVNASARRLVELARARRDEARRRHADTERIVRGPTR